MPYADNARYREYQAQARERRGPDYARNINLRRNYGLTLDSYNRMVALQCGACAICGNVPSEDPDAGRNQKRLHVDHDHKTGKIRGLICSNCNRGIGMLKEDLQVISAALSYLTEWGDANEYV